MRCARDRGPPRRSPLRRGQRITWARVVRFHGLEEVNDLQRTCQVERRHRA